MPPALTAKTFGLPRWAWLAIITSGVGLGLYLRHKADSGEEGEAASESEVEGTPLETVYDSGNPCDPSSGAYNPSECGNQGGGYFYDGTEGSGQAYYPEYPEVTPAETPVPGQVIVNIASPALPSATDGTLAPVGGGAHQGTKPGGKPKVTTGGGPPNRKDNRKPGDQHAGSPTPAQNASGGIPQNNATHPSAVNTGNRCVKGGIGGHTAPAGYHLFCQGDYIWRAPNS